jgi:hypothetical protein
MRPCHISRRRIVGAQRARTMAGDAHIGMDGFRSAWLKQVAGLIGVTPGQLRAREQGTQRSRCPRMRASARVRQAD